MKIDEVRIEQQQQVADIKRILHSPDGEKLLKLLTEEFAERTSFTVGDPHSTSFKEGQRNVVLFLNDMRESKYEILQ